MHYVVFLAGKGFTPYRDIGDMNWPGAYVPDWAITRTLGFSSLAWRVYDFFLLLCAGAAMITIVGVRAWEAGAWAALLFALIHGRDGLLQVGQRDLTMSIFLLIAVALLLRHRDRTSTEALLLFGLCVGAAGMVKPVSFPFLFAAVPVLLRDHKSLRSTAASVLSVLIGCAIPVSFGVGWLTHLGALKAFVHSQQTLTAYHAGLARRQFRFLVLHSFSPLLPIAAAWLALQVFAKMRSPGWGEGELLNHKHKATLYLAAALGWSAYVLQGKGYPYQRYPFLAFLLVLMAYDLGRLLQRRDFLRWASAGIFAAAALGIGLVSVVMIEKYQWRDQEFESSLQSDLLAIESSHGGVSLDGSVQCLDSISGCVATLNKMHLVQATGLMYDEFLFGSETFPAMSESRTKFWRSLEASPPRIFIITAVLFPSGPDGFHKLDEWPQFAMWLNQNYVLAKEHHFMVPVRQGGPAFIPSDYRIYLRITAPPSR